MSLAGKALDLVIPARLSRELSPSEMDKLLTSYGLVKQALNDFLQAKLTWEEYLEILEMHQINIDSYLNTIDYNLTKIGVL